MQLSDELPPEGWYAPGEPMRAKYVVLPTPAICEEFRHRSRDEQLVIEKLIPEPSDERLGKLFCHRDSSRWLGIQLSDRQPAMPKALWA
jgi:hypothetical protein